MSKGFISIWIIVVILILLGGAVAGGYYLGQRNFTPTQIFPAPTGKACTLEAKLCPDGSSVGRSGPNCEFTACPAPLSQNKQIVSSPTPAIDGTANWKTFSSVRCNFSIKVPPEWKITDSELVSGTDNPKYNYGCVDILAPDYKISGESSVGLSIHISRTQTGTRFKTVGINSVEDYIKAAENILEPPLPAKNVQIKTIGGNLGKYYEVSAMFTSSNFIFMKNEYLYNASWIQGYMGTYQQNIDQVLSTFKFI